MGFTTMLTLITPTGDRPEAFTLCQKWIGQQTFSESYRWIVVDDGYTSTKITNSNVHLIRLTPTKENSQARNLSEALNLVEYEDKIVIIEDDDYYGPNWLSIVNDLLDSYDLVGEQDTLFYNVRTFSYRQMRHNKHASLCASAFKGPATDWFKQVCANNKEWLDHRLWKDYRGNKLLLKTNNVIGIKGLPGRPGISIGHGNKVFGTIDRNKEFLKQLIGADEREYSGS